MGGTDGKIYARKYAGRLILRLSYLVFNGTGDIAELTGQFLPSIDAMYAAAIWSANGNMEKIQISTNGIISKVSNVSSGAPITTLLEYH